MATNRLESSGAAAADKGGKEAQAAAPAAAVAAPPSPGFAAYLPLIITVVVMPLLAYGTTTFLLLPKLQRSMSASSAAPAEEAAAPAATGGGRGGPAGSGENKAKEGQTGKAKFTAQMNKVLVNVAGTMGTRYLVVNITLLSKNPGFETAFKDSEAELRHVAISSLSSKTIGDLERPGAKNIIRSELISLFNSVLGNGAVNELFFTEFAVQ